MAHVLLLDLDGVVFQHPAAFARLHARVGAFVATRVPETCVVRDVHEALYRSHGHTLIGLRDAMGDTSSIADFNRFVFDDAFLEEVRRIPRPNSSERHAMAVRRLVASARRRNVDTYLFTNAPRNWVDYALSTSGLKSTFDAPHVLVGEELGFLKPQPEAYAAVEAVVHAERITFVDDSVINLASVPNGDEGAGPDRWVPVLYAPARPAHGYYCPCYCVVHDLTDVAKFLD